MQGIVPASKGFDAVQFTRFCEDLRLINQFKLVIANRFFIALRLKPNALLPFRSSPG